MDYPLQPVHQDQVAESLHPDRWSKDLVTAASGATGGFSLGVAEYTSETFGPVQVHDDQEAVYVVSGRGEMKLGDKVFPVRPGSAAYIPRGMAHATRRTGAEPVKVVYAHGKP
ncbi:MAG: cupin domain-containing protein [Candidatus Glassbacteria bacterium]|nr:cupin domain-containing protein [Candidatus Glassbacteria bacterium]